MNAVILLILLPALLLLIVPAVVIKITVVRATNEDEGSYIMGYWSGNSSGPQMTPNMNENSKFDNNTCSLAPSEILDNLTTPPNAVLPAITNSTSCIHGFWAGWQNWCFAHAVNCVSNITRGDFPPMILEAHEQYLAGAKAANGTGNSMCPIGENAAFCQGWDSNNDDYDTWDCGDVYVNYTGPFSNGLIGCPLDTLKPSQMAKPHVLVGSWHFVNSSSDSTSTIAGTMKFGSNGDATVPSPMFGDYFLEWSWGTYSLNAMGVDVKTRP